MIPLRKARLQIIENTLSFSNNRFDISSDMPHGASVNLPILMQSILKKLSTAAAATIAVFCSLQPSEAAKVTIDGSGFYELSTTLKYYPTGYTQTGRRPYLGPGEYHRAKIGARWLSNNSEVKSGTLSFELWAMPFYGATNGIVLMTSSVPGIPALRYYSNFRRSGHAAFIDRYRHPELNLYEYTRSGWQWRDNLTFQRRTLL
jgi:hypothetical protein